MSLVGLFVSRKSAMLAKLSRDLLGGHKVLRTTCCCSSSSGQISLGGEEGHWLQAKMMDTKTCLLLVVMCLWSGNLLVSGSNLNVCSANLTESVNGSLVLLYTRVAAHDNSTCMHYVWTTRGTNSTGHPTLFSAQTNNTDKACTKNCSDFIDNSTKSVEIPNAVDSYFSIGIVFTRIVEFLVDAEQSQSFKRFNDTLVCRCDHNRTADNSTCFDYPKNYSSISLNDSNIHWNFDTKQKRFAATFIDPDSGNETETKMFIQPYFPRTDEKGQRMTGFPQTQYTANSSIMDFVIVKYPYKLFNTSNKESPVFSRLAMEMYVVHGPNSINGTIWSNVSLDDEYTPSVFTTVTYDMFDDTQDSLRGYVQWKPISYQSSARKSTESQQVNFIYTGGNVDCDTNGIPQGLAVELFNGSDSNVTRWFAVFGTEGDETYLPTNYSTWTGLIGYGQVPLDTISTVVIITIIVGLGVPAALVVLGGVYVFIRKKPWQNIQRLAKGTQAGYTRLN